MKMIVRRKKGERVKGVCDTFTTEPKGSTYNDTIANTIDSISNYPIPMAYVVKSDSNDNDDNDDDYISINTY